MARNEEERQVEVIEALETKARTLAHSTRDVPNPPDSYTLLAELAATLSHLQQVCDQLGAWHRRVVDGVEYEGEDDRGDGVTGTIAAATALDQAAKALRTAGAAVGSAHTANGVVRWKER